MYKNFKEYYYTLLFFSLFFLINILSLNSLSFSIASKTSIYGYASWYGAKFHGRQTANGETYNMYAMTAAHKTLPFGTYVRVTNIEQNKSVVLRINDRGPFIKNRIIDLSKKAAYLLGFMSKGVSYVKVDVLGHRKPISKKQNTAVKPKYLDNNHPREATGILSLSENEYKTQSTNLPSTNIADFSIIEQENIKEDNYKQEKSIFVIDIKEKVKKTHIKLFKLQIAAYSNIKSALIHKRNMLKKGLETSIILINDRGENIFRLITKKTYTSYKNAETKQREIAKKGINSIILFL